MICSACPHRRGNTCTLSQRPAGMTSHGVDFINATEVDHDVVYQANASQGWLFPEAADPSSVRYAIKRRTPLTWPLWPSVLPIDFCSL